MIPESWVEHRRPGDRELLGWVRPAGDAWVAVDRLGHDVSDPVDWLEAEETLDDLGIGYLSGLWQLTDGDGPVLRVRLVEVSPDRVVVKDDDLGSIDGPRRSHVLPFPAPARLQPFAGDASVLDPGWAAEH